MSRIQSIEYLGSYVDVLADKFVSKTKKSSNGCIEWCGCRDSDGYGRTSVREQKFRTHRLSYMLFVGPIPDGMHVLHDCPGGDNVKCVNPAHLWVGTHEENVADMNKKKRRVLQKSVITDDMVGVILEEYSNTAHSRNKFACIKGAEIGVSPRTIIRIVEGKSRKNC